MEKLADGYFVSDGEVNIGKRILAYVGIGTIAWKVIRFIVRRKS